MKHFLDKKKPTVISSTNSEQGKAAVNIIGECSDEPWAAAEEATGENAHMVIDMKCPLKLQEIQLINGVGDFSTKSFSLFGSQESTGPWSRLYTGEMERSRIEVL